MTHTKAKAAIAGQQIADFPKTKLTSKFVSWPARQIQSRKSHILRECQKSACKHGAPLLDALLARILARGCYGFDVSVEFQLARQLAVLSEREGRAA